MTKQTTTPTKYLFQITLLTSSILLAACVNDSDDSSNTSGIDASDSESSNNENGIVDLYDAILESLSSDCADYASTYEANVSDIGRGIGFVEDIVIIASDDGCSLTSNNIPNHDFNDGTANFATNVAEVAQTFNVPRSPTFADEVTFINQRSYDGIMLNGIPIDLLSAGCYSPNNLNADPNGNIMVGCNDNSLWLLDPLGADHKFGADSHNAHTQPNGSYHYHGSPNALFNDSPGVNGSPVIGFAADGFPIYGSYFLDTTSGSVRKAVSGYSLKAGERPTKDDTNPGNSYDGTYVQDWEFTDAGDLDQCNGMTVDGQYGYYVTDSYPWLLKCLSGTPDESFNK